ncbi:hypothetical protein OBBRIDRAFT_592293 [Obba rivulosa]|uniref:Uncharacterized protein n=1 Tax=Obba rivulosa TaxID=1052685 RepID=A0A8E2DM39_9APHY|nr:hypothetical protein OBBRIDRAFT_592293 [Obba rivulosa]
MSSAHGRSSLAPSSISDVHSYSGSSSSSYHRRADSGYGSGSSPAGPLYDAYMRWKEADDARRRLPDEEHDVEECKKLLQEKRGAEQNQSSPRPGQAKRKPSVLHLIPFKSSKHSSHPEDAIHVSPEHNTTPVTVLELQLKELTERADATRQLAESLDARFDALKSCLEDGHIPLWHVSDTQGRLSQAEKAVSSREAAYNGVRNVSYYRINSLSFSQTSYPH